MKNPCIAGLLMLSALMCGAQELPLLSQHPGSFEVLKRSDYTDADCGYTRDEIQGNLEKISQVIAVMRQNPVLANPTGYDGRARIYNAYCHYTGSYGIPSRLSFEFAAWFQSKNGTPVRNFIEPPEWSMMINQLFPHGGNFETSIFSSSAGYFTVPDTKETIAPGIDVYDGEFYVVYKPDRPAYWIPVSVSEAFDAVRKENNQNPDKTERDFMAAYTDQEWEAIPPEDRIKPATLSGMFTRVGTKPGFPCIMKINPAYWDKSQPNSCVQFIYFHIPGNQQYLVQRADKLRAANSTSYPLARFEASLNTDLIKLLQKQTSH